MNNLKLTRLNEPDFDKFKEMTDTIQSFLYEDVDYMDEEWIKNLEAILDFQDTDGSFKLYCSYEIPSDVRVDICHMPTYICSAILMKAYLLGDYALMEKVENALRRGLKMCCARGLNGHGFGALKGKIEALYIFMKGGLREFIDLYPDISHEFTEMILKIEQEFEKRVSEKDFRGSWRKSYEGDILRINGYFNSREVFVYGTLMKGESNHQYLEDSEFIGVASVDGYEMYNVGWYPAIVAGEDIVPGELYNVPKEDIDSIDMLEGEGSLYIRRCKMTSDGSLAYIYEYAQDTMGLEKIDSWKDCVWYVAYGSNMLFEKLCVYIEGGYFRESDTYKEPCRDTTLPIEKRTVEIPYDMYFGNESRSWKGSGVSFLDTCKKGHAIGVAYLMTREQFDHIARQENNGKFPGNGKWYNDKPFLGEMDGYEMLTVSNDRLRKYNNPSNDYLDILKEGIMENWPEMTEEDIDKYLDGCIRE